MADKPYDPAGAMNGLFAPAYVAGDPTSHDAVAKWMAENFAMTPEMIEASRGPSTTVTNPAVGGLRRGNGTTTTMPGTVDPKVLQILAQGGKYDPGPRRDAIAQQLMANQAAAPAAVPAAAAAAAPSNMFAGPNGVPLIRGGPPAGGLPPGMQMANSPLIGLMGEGDNTAFMQGGFRGGA
jgi:hypothetical protein